MFSIWHISVQSNFLFFPLFLAGELRVTQAGRDLRTLTTGDVFGELAILYNCKRTATVKGRPPWWWILAIYADIRMGLFKCIL